MTIGTSVVRIAELGLYAVVAFEYDPEAGAFRASFVDTGNGYSVATRTRPAAKRQALEVENKLLRRRLAETERGKAPALAV